MRGKKIMALLWIIIAIVATAVLVAGLVKGKSGIWYMGEEKSEGLVINRSELNLESTLEFDASKIDSMDIQLVSESLFIEKNDSSDKVVVEFYCPENLLPTAKMVNTTLKIEAPAKKVNFVTVNRKVVVKIPNNLKLSDFDGETVSGSIHVISLECDNLDLNSTSGSIKINDSDVSSVDIKSASGSIKLENLKSDSVEAKSQSGSIHVENCKIAQLEANSTSGSVNAEGTFDSIELVSTSGSIRAQAEKPLTSASELRTVSGSIHLVLPEDSCFVSEYHTTSGIYKNEFTSSNGKKGSESVRTGGPKIELRSSSGSIKVEKK